MAFDTTTFTSELRRALGGEPADTAAPAAPAPAGMQMPSEPVAVDLKTAPVYAWTLTPTRDQDGYIVSVDLRPTVRINLTE